MDKTQSQGKIIIEVQPEGKINPNTGKPCDGSISIQIKALLSEDDRVVILHALASSLSNGNNIEALSLLDTAGKHALHTCLTGEPWWDIYEQAPDGTLIDKRVVDALRKKKKEGEDN